MTIEPIACSGVRHASLVYLSERILFNYYNHERPHQALKGKKLSTLTKPVIELVNIYNPALDAGSPPLGNIRLGRDDWSG